MTSTLHKLSIRVGSWSRLTLIWQTLIRNMQIVNFIIDVLINLVAAHLLNTRVLQLVVIFTSCWCPGVNPFVFDGVLIFYSNCSDCRVEFFIKEPGVCRGKRSNAASLAAAAAAAVTSNSFRIFPSLLQSASVSDFLCFNEAGGDFTDAAWRADGGKNCFLLFCFKKQNSDLQPIRQEVEFF